MCTLTNAEYIEDLAQERADALATVAQLVDALRQINSVCNDGTYASDMGRICTIDRISESVLEWASPFHNCD